LLAKSKIDVKRFTLLGRNINILLLGTDIQNHNEKLSLLSIASVNFKKQKYLLLSIPVDTKVSTMYKELGKRTISQVYEGGGVKLTIATLEELIDEKIPYYIMARRRDAQKIVDLLNGIEILISKKIAFRDKFNNIRVNIPPGWQRLDGEKASQYAYLSYKGERRNNIIKRQQKYIESIVRKLFSQESPLFHSELFVKHLKDNVCTNLTLKDINYFIDKLSDFDYRELKLAVLEGKGDKEGYFIPDLEKNRRIITKLIEREIKEELLSEKKEDRIVTSLKEEEFSDISENIRVRILNGCGRKGIAHRLKKRLEMCKNLQIMEVGNADSFDYKNTIIYDHVGKLSNANYIKSKFLKQGVIKQYIDRTLLADVTIIIGKDFKH
jgi:LCP family protein required for cell wall assembly